MNSLLSALSLLLLSSAFRITPSRAQTALSDGSSDLLHTKDIPQLNGAHFRITALEERDGDVLVRLHAGEPLVAKVTPGAARALSLVEGGEVHVIVKAQAIRRLA